MAVPTRTEHSETAEVERQRVVTFLRTEASKFSDAAHFARGDDDGTRLRLEAKASVINTLAAYIERGDHMVPAARGDL